MRRYLYAKFSGSQCNVFTSLYITKTSTEFTKLLCDNLTVTLVLFQLISSLYAE